MNTLEKKFLSKVDKLLPILVITAVTILGAFIRISLRGIVSVDVTECLLPWYETISQNGLYKQVGDYNLVYQFLIWIMTKFALPPLYSYKLLSCTFDYLLAIISVLLVTQIDSEKRLWNGIWTYSAILLCPVVFVNSAAWAQCDAIYSTFAILGIYFLEKERYNCALISLGMCFAFKLHAVFILPVYLFVYFVRRKFSLIRFILVPITMLVAASPLLFWGRNLLDTFSIYYKQTSSYHSMALNYPSFWTILCSPLDSTQYVNLKTTAVIFTICVLAIIMLLWIRNKHITTGKNLIIMTFILAYTCVLFLPSMHERYGYLYEMCAIILAVLIPRTIPLCLGLLLISLNAYGVFLFNTTVNFTILSFANIALYIAYFYMLTSELQKNAVCVQSEETT